MVRERRAPDGTPVFTAAAPVGERGEALLTPRNATHTTLQVRDARPPLAIIIGIAMPSSTLLPLFLPPPIAHPPPAPGTPPVAARRGAGGGWEGGGGGWGAGGRCEGGRLGGGGRWRGRGR